MNLLNKKKKCKQNPNNLYPNKNKMKVQQDMHMDNYYQHQKDLILNHNYLLRLQIQKIIQTIKIFFQINLKTLKKLNLLPLNLNSLKYLVYLHLSLLLLDIIKIKNIIYKLYLKQKI